MKQQILKLNEVRQLPKNSDFTTMGIITRISTRKDRNDNIFWDLALSDPTGEIEGKAWSTSSWWNSQGGDKFMIDPDNCGFKIEGLTAGFLGTTGDFKGQLQYNFNEIYIVDQNQYPPSNFTKRSNLSQDFLENTFKKLIDEISSEPIRSFLNNVFFKHGLWEKYRLWPAAVTLHHAYTGGLLEHSISVALGAKGMAEHYEDFKISVDIDLIVAGALLHDIGKIEAYSAEPAPAVKIAGNVIEHVTLGYGMFIKYAELEKLDEDIKLALSHIILSHHGKREFGSPVLPETPEAFIISAADDIDFKLTFWKTQIEALGSQSDITELFPMLERRLWRGISQK